MRSRASSYKVVIFQKNTKPRTAALGRVRRTILFNPYQPLPQVGTAQHDRSPLTLTSLSGERENRACLQCPSISVHCQWSRFLSHFTWSVDETSIFRCLGAVKNKEKGMDKPAATDMICKIERKCKTWVTSSRREGGGVKCSFNIPSFQDTAWGAGFYFLSHSTDGTKTVQTLCSS